MLIRLRSLLLIVVLAGCATVRQPAGRVPTGDEIKVLEQAIRPLLEELDYRWPQTPDDCRVGLTIWQSAVINASSGRGRTTPCLYFRLGVTEGALQRLPVEMLRAILAHELGHVRLSRSDVHKEPGSDDIDV